MLGEPVTPLYIVTDERQDGGPRRIVFETADRAAAQAVRAWLRWSGADARVELLASSDDAI